MRWLDVAIRLLQHVHHFLLACVQVAEVATQENTQENEHHLRKDIQELSIINDTEDKEHRH